MFSKQSQILQIILTQLSLISFYSCGQSDGYAVSGTLVTRSVVYVGNYGSGTIAAAELKSDGTFERAMSNLTTGAALTNINGFAFSKNSSGSANYLYAGFYNSNNLAAYRIEQLLDVLPGRISESATTTDAAGSALTISSDSRFLYSVDSATSSNNLVAYSLNSTTGAMTLIGTYSAKNNPSSVVMTPDQKFVFVANQGSADVSGFQVTAATGALTSLGTATATNGAAPVQLIMAPSGLFLYSLNTTAKTISQFSINAATGALSLVSSTTAVGNGPVRMTIDPIGRFIYVSNTTDGTISAFTIDAVSGALTAVSGSPFNSSVNGLSGPYGIKVDPAGQFLVVGWTSLGKISVFNINPANGVITETNNTFDSGSSPRSVEILELKQEG